MTAVSESTVDVSVTDAAVSQAAAADLRWAPRLWASLAVALASLLGATGLILIFYVEPTPDGMARSLIDLREVHGFAAVRSLHAWTSHALVIVLWLHLLRVFAQGSYRRLHDWRSTLIGLLVLLALAASGHALAYGSLEPDSMRVFYALHVVLLPLLLAATFGLWRVRR